MRVVQSGDTQFVLVRPDEFAAQLQGLDDKGKEKLHKEIKDHWNQAFQSAKGELPERSEPGLVGVLAAVEPRHRPRALPRRSRPFLGPAPVVGCSASSR
jgi:hypothetical protein